MNLNVTSNEESIRLCKISDDFPPKILFCIEINRSFAVKAYRGSTPVNLYDILLHSFQHKITPFSQISQILEKVETSSTDIHSELKAAGKNLSSLRDKAIDDDDTRKKLEFICTRLSTHSLPGQHQGKQYSPFLLSEAANLYLRSRNAYRALRLILILPP